jgi:bilirubin oxidase
MAWKGDLAHAFVAMTGATAELDPTSIPKYRSPLVLPPAMPRTTGRPRDSIDYYEIAVRQFSQQILPAGMPQTTVWSYGSVNDPGTFNYPAFTIEATQGTPVRVKWINGLVDADGRYLPHLLPVDPTLHWANPPGGQQGRDMRPEFAKTPTRYTGPVPLVTHLHGGENTLQDSDGFAEAWYLPAARNIPGTFARVGSWYQPFRAEAQARMGQAWTPGTAVFEYANEQRAATLWYHDHTLGMTRVNVYAGPAGFYLVRGGIGDMPAGVLPGPAPALGDLPGTKYYEIPIAIQDRSFKADGSLSYPDSRELFDGFTGPYIPDSDVSPIWNPEFFGNTIVVNGRTWPFLEVEPRRYRFRFLNGCNSRFLILKLANDLPFWQIGAEGGFLPSPVQLEQLLMSPAERADVIVDFSGLASGTELLLRNIAPDEPFGGGTPDVDFPVANPTTTGQVMLFRVVPLTGPDASTPPDQLRLPAPTALPAATNTRRVSLNEADSETLPEVGPSAAFLGTLAPDGTGSSLPWDAPITENPAVGSTEIWELHNFTEDAHPIHVHEVQFQVVDRQPFDSAPRPPEPWETGLKDTVISYPGEVTRIKARFGVAGLFVWHCHIVEHEDNEMMRPYRVGPMP